MTPDETRAILQARFGDPIPSRGKYIEAYETTDGRQIALDSRSKRVRVWFEAGRDNWWSGFDPVDPSKHPYSATQGRNTNLPNRLNHMPDLDRQAQGFPRPVVYLQANDPDALQAMLDAYTEDGVTTTEAAAPSNIEIDGVMPMPLLHVGPTNLIMYGPPGTGKTYRTIAEAVSLCDGENAPEDRSELDVRFRQLLESDRIAFVTFHQTYGYEDFVEGLRPPSGEADTETITDDGEAALQIGLRLDVRDGVFVRLAKLAASSTKQQTPPISMYREDGSPRTVWKMSLGSSVDEDEAEIFEHCIERNEIALGWGDEVDWTSSEYDGFAAIKEKWLERFGDDEPLIRPRMLNQLRNEMQEGDLVIVSEGLSRFRAVGEVTGPYRYDDALGEGYYSQRRPVRWLRVDPEGIDFSTISNVGVTMRSIYRMKYVNLAALLDLLSDDATDATEAPEERKPYVLIIDEINRANISKVLGELITLLEPDKRTGAANELSVTLPFSGEPFTVPPNLHLIGTMNTADRSIALLDTALRRRFRFEEVRPDPGVLAEERTKKDGTENAVMHDVPLDRLLATLNERIEYLFDRDHTIGHSYLMGCSTRADVDGRMREQIIPLLIEYFHEDWEKVRLVLGETNDAGKFVSRHSLKAPPNLEQHEDRFRYEVRSEFPVDAYISLIGEGDGPANRVTFSS